MAECIETNLVDVLATVLDRYLTIERFLSVDENDAEQVRLFMIDNNGRFVAFVNKFAGHVPDGLTFFERMHQLQPSLASGTCGASGCFPLRSGRKP